MSVAGVKQRWDNERWEWVDIPDPLSGPVVVDPGSWEFVGDIPENAGLSVGSGDAAGEGLTYGTYSHADLPGGWSWLRPDPEPPTERPDRSAYVECWLGGALVTTGHSKPGGKKSDHKWGYRGSITRFTFASRRRLLRRLAQTKRDAIPLFACLTYPDRFPSDPLVWKEDLRKFWMRLHRHFPKACIVWRLHTVDRKSGQNKGEIAPHFHLLVWGVSLADMRDFMPGAWYETVASGDAAHLERGSYCEHPMSFKAVMKYVSDEFAKVEQATPVDLVGRWWGFYGRKFVPWALPFRFPVSDQEVYKLMRWFRRFAGLRSLSYKSLSIFCDADFWLRKIRAGPDPPMNFEMWVDTLAAGAG